MSKTAQARELIEEVLLTHYVDEPGRRLLRKALQLMRKGKQ